MPGKERHKLRGARHGYPRTLVLEVLGKPEIHNLVAKAILAAEEQCLVRQILILPNGAGDSRKAKDVDETSCIHHLQSLLEIAVTHFVPPKIKDNPRIILFGLIAEDVF
jgi:hypothetical protein